MKFTLKSPTRNSWKLVLALGVLISLVVIWPGSRLMLRWLYDPDMPESLVARIQERRNRVAFDPAAWREFKRGANTNEWPHTKLLPVRLRMVDSLLKKFDLKGMTRAEIDSLLGPRTQTAYFDDWDLVYYLGPGRYGNAIGDSEWLVIRFDPSDRVKEHAVVHD